MHQEVERLRNYLRRVTGELRTTRQMLAQAHEPIAIVGMGCRFPGSSNPCEFWQNLADGVDGVGPFPTDRGWDLEMLSAYAVSPEGGFVEDAYDFDAGFFGINPREALAMDPQQRLTLQVAWEALEDARLNPAELRGQDVGVFSGVMYQDYGTLVGEAADMRDYLSVGGSNSVVSGRVSYTLGFRGPALSVDTACSSSLVALHLAVSSLRRHETSCALVTGGMIMSTPAAFESYGLDGALSATARCRAFSEDADGTGWGEGVGVLVLERLGDAQRLGHRVLALIRGTAVNQDGASSGLTAPNGPAQAHVIRAALEDAGLEAADIDLIEAHGTGTRLGDPIEAGAIHETYGQAHDATRPVYLGSVKSNIGHTQAAAGVAGVIKVVQSMRHNRMPKTLHVSEPTSAVDWDGSVSILTDPRPWGPGEQPRRGAVSAFGFSGTNAHVILEEAPVEETAGPEAEQPEAGVTDIALPLVLSAPTRSALDRQVDAFTAWLEDHNDADVDAVAATLARTRTHFPHRFAVSTRAAAGIPEAIEQGSGIAGIERAAGGRTVFIYPGQGGHWEGMGKALMDQSPVFASAVAECAAAFGDELDFDLTQAIASGEAGRPVDPLARLHVCSFALAVGLTRIWQSVGIVPDAVLGVSMGEASAWWAAGALTLEQAARVVLARARLLDGLAGDYTMLAVRTSAAAVESQLRELGLTQTVWVVSDTSPASCTVLGATKSVDRLETCLTEQGIRTRIVREMRAPTHSPIIEGLRDDVLNALVDLTAAEASIPVYSATYGGRLASTGGCGAEHWFDNLRNALQVRSAVTQLAGDGFDVAVEISTHPSLRIDVELSYEELGQPIQVITSLQRGGDMADLDAGLAAATVAGIADIRGLWAARRSDLGDAPTYAFEGKRYFVEPSLSRTDLSSLGLDSPSYPLLDAQIQLASGRATVMVGQLAADRLPWLRDHVLNGRVLLPGTAFVELALQAGDALGCLTLDELVLVTPVEVSPGRIVNIQVVVEEADEQGHRACGVWSRASAEHEWTLNATGRLSSSATPVAPRLTAWPPAEAEPIDVSALYEGYDSRGLSYGPAFRGLVDAWRCGADTVAAEVALPESIRAQADDYIIHPALLDAALHAIANLLGADGPVGMPFAWSGVRALGVGAKRARVLLTRQGEDRVQLVLYDGAGDVAVHVENVVVRAPEELSDSGLDANAALFETAWEEIPTESPAGARWYLWGTPTMPWDSRVVGCWSPDDGRPQGRVVLPIPRDLGPEKATAHLMEKLQDWLAHPEFEGNQLDIFTSGAVALDNDVPVDVGGAAVWGFVRTAQGEHPGQFRLIDLDDDPASWSALDTIPRSCKEVAIRSGRSLGQMLRRRRPDTSALRQVDPERTVVISGVGGIGTVIARALVTVNGARHVLLASRRGEKNPATVELADELQLLGASVTVVAADVSDPRGVDLILSKLDPRHPLGTVVHTAGVLRDSVMARLDSASLAPVFAAKTRAVALLDEATRSMNLDDFIVCSSAAGTFGALGQANYAAANAGLDALCHNRRMAGLPATSLAWGPWVAQNTAASVGVGASSGLSPISFDQGKALFEQALHDGVPSLVLPLVLDLGAVRRHAESGSVPDLLLKLAGIRQRRLAAAADGADWASLPLETAREKLSALAAEVTASVLGYASMDDVPLDLPFRDLGIDSLTALRLRNRLAEVTGLRLPVTLVFDHPTVTHVVEFLLSKLVDAEAPVVAPAVMSSATTTGKIAVIGAACRLPGGVRTPADLWRLVIEGGDGVGPVPEDRQWRPVAENTPEGGFIDGAYDFDPAFFSISRREALAMDPVQRLSLELAWEALERAHIDPTGLRGSATAVYVGLMHQDYKESIGVAPEDCEAYLGIGHSDSVVSGRLSYTLGLQGPAVSVNTACSSSLVAVHLGVQALRSGEASLALAGGGGVMSTELGFSMFGSTGGLSATGRCRAFSDSADGTGLGEGVAFVVLERLEDALAAGHPVLAVIEGSAVTQDGASNGLTAPNGQAQELTIRRALADAGVEARQVDLLEAHGTGTRLGDPVEVGALMRTYGREHPDDEPLWIGTLKSNIAHTQAAAGAASLVKTVEAIRHGIMPPTIHVDSVSSHIDWDEGAVRPLLTAQLWPQGHARRAAVSSFGISGTNAHLILTEAPTRDEQVAPVGDVGPIVISGKSPRAAQEQAERVADFLERGEAPVADIAQVLAMTRPSFPHHIVAAAATPAKLATVLRDVMVATAPALGRTAFVFNGAGAHRFGMGRELAGCFPTFAAAIDEIAEIARPILGQDLRAALWRDEALLESLPFAQAGSFAIQIALTTLLREHGVIPQALVGHSLGAIAAAHVAGVLSLSDALTLVVRRAQLLEEIPGVAIEAVKASEHDVLAAMEGIDDVDITVLNSALDTVIAGSDAAVAEVLSRLDAHHVKLRFGYPSHTRRAEAIADELTACAAAMEHHPPQIPLLSNLDGRPHEQVTPETWATLARMPVRFGDCVAWLRDHGYGRMVELGALAPLTPAIAAGDAWPIPTLRSGIPEPVAYATALGAIHASGGDVSWPAYFGRDHAPTGVSLPTYPFQRETLRIPKHGRDRSSDAVGTLVDDVVTSASSGETLAKTSLVISDVPWLGEHRLSGQSVLPGAAWIDIVLETAERIELPVIDELIIESPLTIDGDHLDLQVSFEPTDGASRRFTGHARVDDGPWIRHISGRISSNIPATASSAIAEDNATELVVDGLYQRMSEAGIAYGPTFQSLVAARQAGDVVWGEMRFQEPTDGHIIHPALLDACIHPLMLTTLVGRDGAEFPFIWEGVHVHRRDVPVATSRIELTGPSQVRMDLFDAVGNSVATVERLTLRKADLVKPRRHHLIMRWDASDHQAETERVEVVALDEADAVAAEEVRRSLDCGAGALTRYLVVPEGSDNRIVETVAQVHTALITTLEDDDVQRVVLVHRGATTGASLANAAVWGMGLTAQVENPGRVGLLDLDPTKTLGFVAVDGQIPQARLCQGVLQVPRLQALPVPEAELEAPGAVLILGGGAIGLEVARGAASRGAASVVIASRKGAHASGIAELRDEFPNIPIEAVACDATDPDAVRTCVELAPRWDEVYFTAAALHDGVLHGLHAQDFQTPISVKIDGARALLAALEDRPAPSRICFFSSVAGVLGSAGQGTYAAANAALDALAMRHRALGVPVQSLAWGAWGETGLAVDLSARATGLAGLSTREGLDLLWDASAHDAAALVPLALDYAALHQLADQGLLPPLLNGIVERRPTASRTATPESNLNSLSPKKRASAVLDLILREMATVLKCQPEDIDPDRPLGEYGFDSLMALELRNRITQTVAVRLSATVVFEQPTASALAAFVANEMDAPVAPVVRDDLITLQDLYRQALDQGQLVLGTKLLHTAASLRPTFSKGDGFTAQTVVLAAGDEPTLYCFNSCMQTAGTQSYAQLGRILTGRRRVVNVTLPGFVSGESLPDSVEAVMAALADAVEKDASEHPKVFLGTSAGGWFAHGAAAALEARGGHVDGVILVDAYPPQVDFLGRFGLALIAGMNERAKSFDMSSDARLTASGWYGGLFADHRPEAIRAREVLLRATEPLAPTDAPDWRATWPTRHESIDIDGDHFTVLETQCKQTTEVIESWITNLGL